MTSALNAFQTTVGGQGRSETEGGRGEERRDHDGVKEKKCKKMLMATRRGKSAFLHI